MHPDDTHFPVFTDPLPTLTTSPSKNSKRLKLKEKEKRTEKEESPILVIYILTEHGQTLSDLPLK